jgi:hypothetical protein
MKFPVAACVAHDVPRLNITAVKWFCPIHLFPMAGASNNRISSSIPLSSGERLSGLHGLLHGHLFASEPTARNVFKIEIPGRLPVVVSDFKAAGLRHHFVFDNSYRHRAILLATCGRRELLTADVPSTTERRGSQDERARVITETTHNAAPAEYAGRAALAYALGYSKPPAPINAKGSAGFR